MGVTFSHPLVGNGTPLHLRLNPTEVEWTYNLNTQVTNTYGGQVIQVLSINYDQLKISGRFGIEGPHGIFRLPDGSFTGRASDKFVDWEIGGYGVGLVQMYHYFQDYFAIASQGGDALVQGNYNQQPVTLTYQGTADDKTEGTAQAGTWSVYPIDFPSYSRSLDNFAPMWTVTCEIEEADYKIHQTDTQAEIDRLRANIGYTPFNPYSDPLGAILNTPALRAQTAHKALQNAVASNQSALQKVFDHYGDFLPSLTESDINDLVLSGASFPNVYQKALNNALHNSFTKLTVGQNSFGPSGERAATTPEQDAIDRLLQNRKAPVPTQAPTTHPSDATITGYTR